MQVQPVSDNDFGYEARKNEQDFFSRKENVGSMLANLPQDQLFTVPTALNPM
jgi:hypothetical protein